MQGNPEAPMCGFSNMVCKILDAYGKLLVLGVGLVVSVGVARDRCPQWTLRKQVGVYVNLCFKLDMQMYAPSSKSTHS